jgi:hypothetical protein
MSDEEEDYVDDARVQLDSLDVPAPDGMDFGEEHVQWALNTEMPGHISGIDYSQRPEDQGESVV